MNILSRISAYNRKRKWDIFIQEMQPIERHKILDVGYTGKEYLPSDNYLEKNYPYPYRITALGIDNSDEFKKKYPQVRVLRYEGASFPFQDQEFDVCWANAVIEHVGAENKQALFLSEMKRVAKKVFFTTPNRWFPIEVHTRIPLLHYLPKKYFDRLLIIFNKGWAAGEYMNLLSLSRLNNLLYEAAIVKYKIITNRLFGLALDYIIIFDSCDNVNLDDDDEE